MCCYLLNNINLLIHGAYIFFFLGIFFFNKNIFISGKNDSKLLFVMNNYFTFYSLQFACGINLSMTKMSNFKIKYFEELAIMKMLFLVKKY